MAAWLAEHAASGRVGVAVTGTWGRGTGDITGIALSISTMNLPAPTNRRWVVLSSAIPVGPDPGATDQLADTFLAATYLTRGT